MSRIGEEEGGSLIGGGLGWGSTVKKRGSEGVTRKCSLQQATIISQEQKDPADEMDFVVLFFFLKSVH